MGDPSLEEISAQLESLIRAIGCWLSNVAPHPSAGLYR